MIKRCFLFQAEDSHVTGATEVVWVQELRALDVGMYDGDPRDSQRHLLPHSGEADSLHLYRTSEFLRVLCCFPAHVTANTRH